MADIRWEYRCLWSKKLLLDGNKSQKKCQNQNSPPRYLFELEILRNGVGVVGSSGLVIRGLCRGCRSKTIGGNVDRWHRQQGHAAKQQGGSARSQLALGKLDLLSRVSAEEESRKTTTWAHCERGVPARREAARRSIFCIWVHASTLTVNRPRTFRFSRHRKHVCGMPKLSLRPAPVRPAISTNRVSIYLIESKISNCPALGRARHRALLKCVSVRPRDTAA